MKGRNNNEKNWLVILLIAVLAILPGIIMLVSTPKVEAQTKSTTTYSWQVSFTEALKERAVAEGDVYVTNSKNQKVTASVTFGEDKQTMIVSDLAPGSYKLHVKKEAFVLDGPKTTSQVIAFTIIEKLEAVKSEKELQQYFETLLANSQKELNEATVELAKSEDKASADNSSTTNNQVEGVEEGDIVVVKDGFIYAVKDQGITVVNAKDPKKLQLATTIKLKESRYISKLALYDNLLIVIGDEYLEKAGTSMSTASLYDISNPKNPKLIREVGQEGYLNDIRITDDTLYLIGNMYPNYWMLREQKRRI